MFVHLSSKVFCLMYCHFRLDKELGVLEKANRVVVRWNPNDEQYQAAVQAQVVCKCHHLVEKMKPVSQERLFLLKLKEKYSGNVVGIFVLLFHNV